MGRHALQKMAVNVAACGELDQLTWTEHLSRHLTRRLAHTVCRGRKYIIDTTIHSRSNQLNATLTVIFSWNPYLGLLQYLKQKRKPRENSWCQCRWVGMVCVWWLWSLDHDAVVSPVDWHLAHHLSLMLLIIISWTSVDHQILIKICKPVVVINYKKMEFNILNYK